VTTKGCMNLHSLIVVTAIRLRSGAVAVAAFTATLVPSSANAQKPQSCPTLLTEARRLVLVTADNMNAAAATMRLFERGSPNDAWRQLSTEHAVVGKTGIGWSQFFRTLARPGEPTKVEGDKRAPAGIYAIGRSFGVIASTRPDYLHVTPDTVCVDDPSSPAYNTIASRAQVGAGIHAENMSRIVPMYRRCLLVDYPTDARRRAGSCIFIPVWRSPGTGMVGCVALPEPRMDALQDFAQSGAVLAILPTSALDRLPGCLPKFSR